jgi:hypothetical protein
VHGVRQVPAPGEGAAVLQGDLITKRSVRTGAVSILWVGIIIITNYLGYARKIGEKIMKTKTQTVTFAAALALLAHNAPAYAENFISPIQKAPVGMIQGSAYIGESTVTFEDDNNNEGDIDRSFFAFSGAYGLNEKLDVFASIALINDAELENFPSDGDGTAIAIGARGKLPVNNPDFTLHGYAQFLMIDEDYGKFSVGGESVKISSEETLISGGVMAVTKMDKASLYGGIDLNLISDGQSKIVSTVTGTEKFDAERNDLLNVRVGADIEVETMMLNIQAGLMGDKGFMFGLTKNF